MSQPLLLDEVFSDDIAQHLRAESQVRPQTRHANHARLSGRSKQPHGRGLLQVKPEVVRCGQRQQVTYQVIRIVLGAGPLSPCRPAGIYSDEHSVGIVAWGEMKT